MNIKNTKTYICTHPSFGSKKYVGATYEDLATYNTNSAEIQKAIAETGIRPEFTIIENHTFDANTAKPDDFQFVYKREQEVYDLLVDMGVELINEFRPSGYCPFADPEHITKRTGTGNCNYDHEVRKWINYRSMEEKECTQWELRNEFNLHKTEIRRVLNDWVPSVKGWLLKEKYDKAPIHRFMSESGKVIEANIFLFCHLTDLKLWNVNNLVKQKCMNLKGWSIQPTTTILKEKNKMPTKQMKTNGAEIVDGRFKFKAEVIDWVMSKYGFDQNAGLPRSRNYALALALDELRRVKE